MENRKGSRRRLPAPQLQWEVDDEALAYYVAAARYGGKTIPESVRVEMDRIDAAAKSDPVFAARLDSLTRRIEELDGDGATTSYRRITEDPPSTPPPRVEEPLVAPVSRPARRRGLRAVAFAVPIAATILIAIALWPSNEYRDLSAIEPIRPFDVNLIVLRGETGPTEAEFRDQLDRARGMIEASSSRVLGVIRVRNDELLRAAIEELESARSQVHPGSPAHAAVAYHLAKAQLALERPQPAIDLLEESAAAAGAYALAADTLRVLVEARLKRDR